MLAWSSNLAARCCFFASSSTSCLSYAPDAVNYVVQAERYETHFSNQARILLATMFGFCLNSSAVPVMAVRTEVRREAAELLGAHRGSYIVDRDELAGVASEY